MIKTYKVFYFFALVLIIAAGFPVTVKAACSCTCSPIESQLGVAGPGMTMTAVPVCDKATDNVTLPEQADLPACTAACKALPAPGGIGTPPCYTSGGGGTCATGAASSCWCDAGSGAYKKSETASQTDCKKACADMSQKFAGWGNTPPTPPGAKGSAVSCPPGGDWTSTTCAEAKNSDGVKIGRWDEKTGKCFYNDAPIKLGVGLGTLTQANLAQYLSAAYNLALGFAAVLAVIFIMIGGFRYLSAAGGAGVEEGKSMIKNAVVGLVLAALSYTLLLTVNPDILSLRLPTITLIKACEIKPVDCGAYAKKEDCEKNTDPSKKCSWNVKQSACIDFATTQSGAPGQLGGECKKESDGSYTCATGACVGISSTKMICSDGGPCQACVNDTDIDPATGEPRIDSNKQGQCRPDPGSGLPVKCISNKCAQINPNNPPKKTSFSNDNYISCTDAACSGDAQCPANQKCDSKHVCIVANQGTTGCSKDGDCRTQDGQQCVSFTRNGEAVSDQNQYWKKACCKDGEMEGCLGCSPIDTYQGTDDNPACPKTMKCDPTTLKCIYR